MLPSLPDWPQRQQHLQAFWEQAILDRVVIQVTAPLPYPAPRPSAVGLTLEARWTDPAHQIAVLEADLASRYYAGDAFPTYRPVFGPGFFAGLAGAPVTYADTTVWYAPCLADFTAPFPRFDPAHPLWQRFVRLMRAAAACAPGRFILGQTDMVPSTDILAALLGAEELCVAMLEEPEAVEAWLAAITSFFRQAYQAQAALLPLGNGYTSWLTTWADMPSYALQNDFSCMISAEHFRRFCLAELETLTTMLDRSVYHLDGPGAIQHLDALLELPRLHAIQWTPGDGQPPMSAWIPLLQRIQAAGKGLFLYCAPEEVETLMAALRPEGVVYHTWAPTPEAADALVQQAARWTHAQPFRR